MIKNYTAHAANERTYLAWIRTSIAIMGLGLFLIGILIIVIATWRFFMFKDAIDAEETFPYSVKKTSIILSALITLMALFLFFYMGNQIFSQ